jgi:predicted Holliday junction resolvase-like endonuclease
MKPDIISFFELQRRIFFICPDCDEIVRLSDCRLYLRKKPKEDWLDAIDREIKRLDDLEEKIGEKKQALQQAAALRGRNEARKTIKKIDRIFTPLKLNPDDSKALLHPIDYVVFDGMTGDGGEIKKLVLLDNQKVMANRATLQKSIAETVHKGRYEWQTLRVGDDGEISVDNK